MPGIREGLSKIGFSLDTDDTADNFNMALYLILNFSQRSLSVGCQHCEKFGLFELILLSSLAFEQADQKTASQRLLSNFLPKNITLDVGSYLETVASGYSKMNLNFIFRPIFFDFVEKIPDIDNLGKNTNLLKH